MDIALGHIAVLIMVNGLSFLRHISSLLAAQSAFLHLSDWPIHKHIHTLMAEAAMRGVLGINLGSASCSRTPRPGTRTIDLPISRRPALSSISTIKTNRHNKCVCPYALNINNLSKFSVKLSGWIQPLFLIKKGTSVIKTFTLINSNWNKDWSSSVTGRLCATHIFPRSNPNFHA